MHGHPPRYQRAGDNPGDPQEYQIFIDFPWGSSDPVEMADEVCATFARPPEQWTASWSAVKWDNRERPPAIAGPAWHFVDITS